MQNRPLDTTPSWTLSSIATTDAVSTMIRSPSFRLRYTMVPPADRNATLSLVPAMDCRQHPNPPQQQFRQPKSASQAS
jgi:hypothetical protein